MRVGVYLRLSEETDGLGIDRQSTDCAALVARRGWTGVEYIDPDSSAYKRKRRPAFEDLLRDLEAGQLDGLVGYDLDRIARRPSDLERIIDAYDQRPLAFATVQGELDLSTADGRTMARVLVAFANKSSMDTSRRVTRKHRELAEKGVAVGGHRPFGYEGDKVTIKQDEADLIRKAAADILNGVGLHTIVRSWNEAGITTTPGNPWVKHVFRNMMLSPRLAGFRVYQRKIAVDSSGNPISGQYPAILPIETWEAVCSMIEARKGTAVPHATGRAKYLLSGIVRCSLCSHTLVGNNDARNKTFNYCCPSPTNGGCGKVAISGPKLDAIITDLTLAYLAETEISSIAEPWPHADELAATAKRVAELMSAYGDGTLSADVVFPVVSQLERRSAELKSTRQEWLREQAIRSQATAIPDDWETLDTDRRRTRISAVLMAVVVRPAKRPGGRFDETRAHPVWR